MRVPTNQASASLVSSLHRMRAAEARATLQASSGKRINRPSDDPLGARQAEDLRASLGVLRGQLAGATIARSSLGAVDSSLEAMTDRIGRALELGARTATDLLPTDARAGHAAEVRSAAQSILAEGNRRVSGYALYGGAQTLTDPFSMAGDGSYVYAGDNVVRQFAIDGDSLDMNIPGDQILTGPVNVGAALEGLAQAIETGTSAQIKAAMITVEAAREQLVGARASAGLQSRRLDEAEAVLVKQTEHLTINLADVEDADLVDVITELNKIGLALEATMGASRLSNHGSLFDFLA